jgi:hypothetical protein
MHAGYFVLKDMLTVPTSNKYLMLTANALPVNGKATFSQVFHDYLLEQHNRQFKNLNVSITCSKYSSLPDFGT